MTIPIQPGWHLICTACAIALFVCVRHLARIRGTVRLDPVFAIFVSASLISAWQISMAWRSLLPGPWHWSAGVAFVGLVVLCVCRYIMPIRSYNRNHDGDIRPDSSRPSGGPNDLSDGCQVQGVGTGTPEG